MVEYLCHRCGYIAGQRINLKHHLNRKKMCKPILADISIEDIKKHYNLETKNIDRNVTQICPNVTQIYKNVTPMCPNVTPILPKKNECIFCFKVFATRHGKSRHLKKCKLKKENENEKNLKKQVEELKEMVEKLLINNTGNTTTNNTNSNNTIHNTININNYGEENTKYITSDYILNLLKFKPAKAIPELIKHTHFNDKYPENQNIKITNKKGPHIKVMKNNKWELQNKEETITDLIDRQQVHLLDEEIEEKIEEKCSNIEKGNIDRCSDLYNNEDKDYMKRLYTESELLIINNS